MVQPGMGGLDTPRTNLGDATYLTNHQPDFDISQEQSFQSPSADNNNLVQQLRNGRRGAINLRTPRGRTALVERKNISAGQGGGEFTPLLKSATRNSALRIGKENVPSTPGFMRSGLENIPEDLSPLPMLNSSVYASTPMPQIQSSSAASTPMALKPRRNEGPGVLQDGNQLSLREQENVIDKIEKENFGLKLKIHFLEEALRKAGPGFSEIALKENTDLKVEKVTMQKDMHRCRKALTAAERELESFRLRILELEQDTQRGSDNVDQRHEIDRLRSQLEDKEAELDRLRGDEAKLDDLQDKCHDLEADMREKDRILDDREDEVEKLSDELAKKEEAISDLEESLKKYQSIESQAEAQANEELEDARETIQDLQRDIERLQLEAEDVKGDLQEAKREKLRAESDLEELQEEISNKSMTTKGMNRQLEEKQMRLREEVEDLREKQRYQESEHKDQIQDLKRDSDVREKELQAKVDSIESQRITACRERDELVSKLDVLQKELNHKCDEKDMLQSRHDALTSESAGLQKELTKCRETIEELEDKLDHEKTLALTNEREVRDQYKEEIDRLNDEVEDLRAEVRERERLYDDDNDKWDTERRAIETQRDHAEEEAAGLQRTIQKLQETEGTLSGKETKLQEALESEKERHASQDAVLVRQISELEDEAQERRQALDEGRLELSVAQEELRLAQREQRALADKVEALEDEVEVLQTSLDDETDRSNAEIAAAKQESQELQKEVRSLKQDLAKAELSIKDARAEIEMFRGDLDAGQGNKEQLDSRMANLESQLTKVRQEKLGLQEQLTTLKMEVHSVRAAKADVEAERDEFKGQLGSIKHQDDETFRLDQERLDLRTTKMKLDSEVRRLRDEIKTGLAREQNIEKQLQEEIDRANAEEARLSTEVYDLQKIIRGSSDKKELAAANKSILRLEARIQELESQIASGDDHADTANELSLIRRDLFTARQKETEYLQREASQKDTLRALKRQISELERKSHETEISRLEVSQPNSSVSGSARKSEIIEVRHQLAVAQQQLKDARSQLRGIERNAAQKVKSAALDLEAKTEVWESEKFELERSLDEALIKRDELEAANKSSESTITRLRAKIQRLQETLEAERQNRPGENTIALERHDLHEMLRETQIEAESLELVVKDREKTIAAISTVESELRAHLRRVRDERALHRSRADSAIEELENLRRRYQEAQEAWEQEKKSLTHGVRFVNTSMSSNGELDAVAIKKATDEVARTHAREMRGMVMQMQWLEAQIARLEAFREDAAHSKRFMALQIRTYDACNKADLALIRTIPGHQLKARPKKKKTLKMVAIMIRAIVRMQNTATEWKKYTAIQDALQAQLATQKRNAQLEEQRAAAELKEQMLNDKITKMASSARKETRRRLSGTAAATPETSSRRESRRISSGTMSEPRAGTTKGHHPLPQPPVSNWRAALAAMEKNGGEYQPPKTAGQHNASERGGLEPVPKESGSGLRAALDAMQAARGGLEDDKGTTTSGRSRAERGPPSTQIGSQNNGVGDLLKDVGRTPAKKKSRKSNVGP